MASNDSAPSSRTYSANSVTYSFEIRCLDPALSLNSECSRFAWDLMGSMGLVAFSEFHLRPRSLGKSGQLSIRIAGGTQSFSLYYCSWRTRSMLSSGAVKQPSKVPGRPNSSGRLSPNFLTDPERSTKNKRDNSRGKTGKVFLPASK